MPAATTSIPRAGDNSWSGVRQSGRSRLVVGFNPKAAWAWGFGDSEINGRALAPFWQRRGGHAPPAKSKIGRRRGLFGISVRGTYQLGPRIASQGAAYNAYSARARRPLLLNSVFGLPKLSRGAQEEIGPARTRRAIAWVLDLGATAAGKSLCYQLGLQLLRKRMRQSGCRR